MQIEVKMGVNFSSGVFDFDLEIGKLCLKLIQLVSHMYFMQFLFRLI